MSNLTSGVVDQIRQQIISGKVSPGDKLPAESALEKQFAVSRTVIREAISRLQPAGLVETYRGKGTYVLTRPSRQPFTADPDHIRTLQDRLDLLDFRIGLEGETAALAARRRTKTQLAAMDRALQTFMSARALPSNAVEADFDFHRTIAIASNNRFYIDLLASLGATMISMPQTRLMQPDAAAQQHHYGRVIEEHSTIHNAIKREDPLGAAAAMRTHLANSRARLIPDT
ncbi:FadR/GntR family transcriptional regulator [Arthrobacter sp. H5]|uniref:FadR/GntR family transcriptional regulator n=1 Tax=Arthrobacter sp. H5 TaxID=1267973 RepID=UPI000488E852|nr:FadR/GntR family transcriptional regulator [Arthrobacter sp. H5]